MKKQIKKEAIPKAEQKGFRLFEIAMIILTPFMPVINRLIDFAVIILKAEFLTPHGKVNVISEILFIISIVAVSVHSVFTLIYYKFAMGDYQASFESPIKWVLLLFVICLFIVTFDRMFSSYLRAKYPQPSKEDANI